MDVEQVQALRLVLLCQCDAGAFQRLAAPVTRPCPQEVPPFLDCSGVNDGGCLPQAMGLGDVDRIAVAIPHELDRSEGMVPAKIHCTKLRPVRRKLDGVAGDVFLGHGEDPAAPKRGDTLHPRFDFVPRVAGDDLLALLLREMEGVVYGGGDNNAAHDGCKNLLTISLMPIIGVNVMKTM